jgi:predicted heme/steroid binding protein
LTPSAPALQADDATDILSASSTLGNSEIEVSENGGSYVAYTGQISVGNVSRVQGYWKFKIRSAAGRNESSIVESPAFTIVNSTPSAPVVVADDATDLLSASSTLGNSEIEVSENGGAYVAYTGQISVGNVSRVQGYWKFKIRSAAGRNESSIVESPAFTIVNSTPSAPVVVADDATDILSASSTLGNSEIEVSENGSSYVAYTGQISVGNVSRVQGYWKFKIRSAAGRNESSIVESPAFTIVNSTPSAPVVVADDATDLLSASSTLGNSEIEVSENGGSYVAYTGQISVGNVSRVQGYWKFKIRSAAGRNESSIVESPAFTIVNSTPSAPVVVADDATDLLSASSTLGNSE